MKILFILIFSFYYSIQTFAGELLLPQAKNLNNLKNSTTLKSGGNNVAPNAEGTPGSISASIFWAQNASNALDSRTIISLDQLGCNSPILAAIPDNPDYFFIRLLQNTNPSDGCSGNTWSIALAKMDWNQKKLSLIKKIIVPPLVLPGGKYTVTTAYDPSVLKFDGKLWVAFECHGIGFQGSVGTCMGPLSNTFELDLAHSYLLVQGKSVTPNDAYDFSASVPKLLNHQGHAYLFWSVARIRKSDGVWADVTTRGVELKLANDGSLWPKKWARSNEAIPSNHPLTTIVWGLESDERSNRIADSFQFISDGQYVYGTGALGGGNCLTPTDNSPGCYRMAIARTINPLNYHAFNKEKVSESLLPGNPHEYSRFISKADGSLWLVGAFLTPKTASDRTIQAGFLAFPIPKTLSWCSSSQKAPDWGQKNGKCLASCGGIGGKVSYNEPCVQHGKADVGVAYDVPFCCK